MSERSERAKEQDRCERTCGTCLRSAGLATRPVARSERSERARLVSVQSRPREPDEATAQDRFESRYGRREGAKWPGFEFGPHTEPDSSYRSRWTDRCNHGRRGGRRWRGLNSAPCHRYRHLPSHSEHSGVTTHTVSPVVLRTSSHTELSLYVRWYRVSFVRSHARPEVEGGTRMMSGHLKEPVVRWNPDRAGRSGWTSVLGSARETDRCYRRDEHDFADRPTGGIGAPGATTETYGYDRRLHR
jgi:hypothetical protein